MAFLLHLRFHYGVLYMHITLMARASDILCTEQESNKMSDKTIKGLQLGDIMVTNCQSLDVLLPIIETLSSEIFLK